MRSGEVEYGWYLADGGVGSGRPGARRPERERETLRDSGCLLGPIIVASMGGTATGARALQYGVPIAMGVKAKQGRQRPGTVTRAMVKSSSLHFLFTDVAQLCCDCWLPGGLQFCVIA